MNFELLKRLCETPGIPGREGPIRAVVHEAMQPLADEVTIDAMGNVVGRRAGRRGPRVMIAAHMDEIGFFVRHIDSDGFLRVHPVGGWDPRTMVAQRVHVHGFTGETLTGALMPARKPTHILTEEERKREPKVEDFFVDLGMPATQVRRQVEPGDFVTMARPTIRVGEMVLSKALDDRLCLYIMLEALRDLGDHDCEIVAVATTQEEVGLRGAGTAAYALEPRIAVALDVTIANDYPGPKEYEQISHLGGGPAIKIMDSSQITNPHLVRHFRDVAEQHEIPYQLEFLARGGTDGGAMQRSRGGVASITLSLPTRYLHTVNEMAALSDIEAAIRLLARYLEQAHTGTYGFEVG